VPLTEDRITAAQRNIATILKAKPESVLNTSEFNDVKDRLGMLHNRRRIDIKKRCEPAHAAAQSKQRKHRRRQR
jgi:hypothetical protein